MAACKSGKIERLPKAPGSVTSKQWQLRVVLYPGEVKGSEEVGG